MTQANSEKEIRKKKEKKMLHHISFQFLIVLKTTKK